ncbi:hypothetical protein BV898_04139 [Hypsibius exemplaris]|uniref:G-protein coupled receptors family 1 profile domain-containing protein n=1 Tax=Hypsibius exemplaris TaxID=2072580 RepID=A0A1W0X361_HYPEX|nr:hypothetical protein BV898_04139 [Hypsibius exemplaris]
MELNNTSSLLKDATPLCQDQYYQLYIFASAALPIIFFGAFGNILTLIVILRARWYATGIQVLILTLTVCGVFTTSLVYPVWFVGAVVGDSTVWLIPGVCRLTGFVFLSVTCMSSTLCAMIAINRLCIIVIPQRTHFVTQKRGGIVMSIVASLISQSIFLSPLLGLDGRFGLVESLHICIWLQWTSSQPLQSAFFLVIYVIPGGVIALCYTGIFLFLRLSHRASANRRRARAASGSCFETSRKLRRLLQATKMMGVTFLAYVVCFLPLNFMAWWQRDLLYAERSSMVFAWLLLLYCTSDCLHPVIYAVMNRDFSDAYIDLLRRCQLFQRKPQISLKDMVHSEKKRSQMFRREHFNMIELDDQGHKTRLIPRDSLPRDTTNAILRDDCPHGGVYLGPPSDHEDES